MRVQGSVSLRPVRVGLLVSPYDIISIRRFVRLCTCLWGGRFNPIIPVSDKIPEIWQDRISTLSARDLAINHISFFEPDVLVESQEGLAEGLGWKRDNSHFGIPRVVSLNEFYETSESGRVDFPLGIDSHKIFADLYHKEYKFERRHKTPFAFFDPLNSPDAFFECVGGTYPADEALKYLVDDYREVFSPETLLHDVDSYFKLVKNRYNSPFFITNHELEFNYQSSHDYEVFVFNPISSMDIIDFWNYRLINPLVLPVNFNWINDCAEYLANLISENFKPLPSNRNGVMVHTSFRFARSISAKRAKEFRHECFEGVENEAYYLSSYHNEISFSLRDDRRWKTKRVIVEAK